MAKNNIVYKEFIFEHTVSVVEHYNEQYIGQYKKTRHLQSLRGKNSMSIKLE